MKRIIVFALTVISLGQFSQARQPEKGYRGFVEWSSSVRSESYGDIDVGGNIYTSRRGTFYTGISTSHGYQINPMFFVGAGLSFEYYGGLIDSWIVPVFLQGRIDLQFDKYTPFGEIRIGANSAEGGGIYFSPSVGYRFNWGRNVGLNVGLGLTLSGYKADHYELKMTSPETFELYYLGTKQHVRPYFSFRVGIDF